MISIVLYSIVAGLMITLGTLLNYLLIWRRPMIAFAFGFSAGVMLFISYFSLLPVAVRYGGMLAIGLGIFSSICFMRLLHLLPLSKVNKGCASTHYERMGFFLIIAVIAHHLPEGAAIGVGFESEYQMGLLLVIALAIHNLPEGIALAIPLVAAGKKPHFVIGWSLLCGLSLPLGTWIGLMWLSHSMQMIAVILAFAAATMIWIMVYEVFPHAYQLGRGWAIIGFVFGLFFMYIVHQFHS